MARATSLNNVTSTAMVQEIGSKYDVVKQVSTRLDDIAAINAAIENGKLDSAVTIVNMTVVTGEEGTEATWNPSTAELTVPRGDSGVDGNTWLSGNANPTGDVGTDGDMYLNLTTYEAFKMVGGSWVSVGVLKGTDGSDGEKGDKGDSGEAGTNGVSGQTPVVTLTYNEVTGDLEYTVTYVTPDTFTEEW